MHLSRCAASTQPSAGSYSWSAAVLQVPSLMMCEHVPAVVGALFDRGTCRTSKAQFDADA